MKSIQKRYLILISLMLACFNNGAFGLVCYKASCESTSPCTFNADTATVQNCESNTVGCIKGSYKVNYKNGTTTNVLTRACSTIDCSAAKKVVTDMGASMPTVITSITDIECSMCNKDFCNEGGKFFGNTFLIATSLLLINSAFYYF